MTSRAPHGELPSLDRLPPSLQRVVRSFDSEVGVRRLRWTIALLLVLAAGLFIGRGGSRPADPQLSDPPGTAVRGISGFGEAGAVVRAGAGERKLCVAVASTEAQREQGLMRRTDMGGYDGMVFRFERPSTAQFYMRNTPMPLAVAWFDAAGRFVSSAEMTPCPDRPGCPLYGAAGPYTVAIEVPSGGLRGLGIGPGSSITVGGSCA